MVCQNMGKASKWIRNFLLGKREKEDKKRVSSIPEQEFGSPKSTAELSVTKEKRRWSFRKPASKTPRDKITNRNRSFDSISTAQLVKQVLEEHEIEQIRVKAHAFMKSCNQVNGSGSVLVATAQKSQLIKPFMKDAAATKIQSAFRSYLARKALRALRALVKLQALVRGHQVRKQTAEVLRSMHALMTIQVRARYKRVQKVELAGPPLNSTKSTTYLRESDLAGKLPSKIHTTLDKLNGDETRRLQSKSGPLVAPQAEGSILEQGLISKCHSSRLSTSKEWEDQPYYGDDQSWSPSTMLAEITSSQKNAKQIFHNNIESKPEFSTKLPASGVPQPHLDSPSYMSNTESSKAKARSQSEPKQRPKRASKQKISRRTTSSEGLNVDSELAADQQLIKHSSYLRYNEQENQQPWLVKLYRSAKFEKHPF